MIKRSRLALPLVVAAANAEVTFNAAPRAAGAAQ